MRFHGKYVSVGESSGEYFAVSFHNADPRNDEGAASVQFFPSRARERRSTWLDLSNLRNGC
jgi:hypothetical protein